jgi:hypothetical protein
VHNLSTLLGQEDVTVSFSIVCQDGIVLETTALLEFKICYQSNVVEMLLLFSHSIDGGNGTKIKCPKSEVFMSVSNLDLSLWFSPREAANRRHLSILPASRAFVRY